MNLIFKFDDVCEEVFNLLGYGFEGGEGGEWGGCEVGSVIELLVVKSGKLKIFVLDSFGWDFIELVC